MTKSADSLRTVAASYRLDRTDQRWLLGLLEASLPAHDGGLGGTGFFFNVATPDGLQPWGDVALDAPDMAIEVNRDFLGQLPAKMSEFIFTRPPICGTLTQLHVSIPPALSRSGVNDSIGIQATDPSGIGCCLIFQLPLAQRLSQATIQRWQQVAIHMSAGLRLRRTLSKPNMNLMIGAEAIVDPRRGRIVHAEAHAQSPDAQQALRRAAVLIDRARTQRGGRDPDGALRAWPALIAGRWTLIEHFSSDGRRLFVARRNEPEAQPLLRLTLGERRVLAHVVAGEPNKIVADKCGIPTATVATNLRRIQAKLGISTRVDLIRIAATMATSGELVQTSFSLDDEPFVLLSEQDHIPRALSHLPAGLEDVARSILEGKSDKEIAAARGTSRKTVANQIRQLFQRFGVHSRAELSAVLSAHQRCVRLSDRMPP